MAEKKFDGIRPILDKIKESKTKKEFINSECLRLVEEESLELVIEFIQNNAWMGSIRDSVLGDVCIYLADNKRFAEIKMLMQRINHSELPETERISMNNIEEMMVFKGIFERMMQQGKVHIASQLALQANSFLMDDLLTDISIYLAENGNPDQAMGIHTSLNVSPSSSSAQKLFPFVSKSFIKQGNYEAARSCVDKILDVHTKNITIYDICNHLMREEGIKTLDRELDLYIAIEFASRLNKIPINPPKPFNQSMYSFSQEDIEIEEKLRKLKIQEGTFVDGVTHNTILKDTIFTKLAVKLIEQKNSAKALECLNEVKESVQKYINLRQIYQFLTKMERLEDAQLIKNLMKDPAILKQIRD